MNHPIPKKAKRVFTGTVFEIYQWQQKMFDGSFHLFERAKRHDGASLIATVGDKIVILRQRQPQHKDWYYTVPGGYLDKEGDNPKLGALRELREETGLKPKTIKLWKKFYSGTRVSATLYVYIARDCKKIGKQELDSGEQIEVKLVNFEEFLKLSDNPRFVHRELIPEMLRARLSSKAKAKFKKEIFG